LDNKFDGWVGQEWNCVAGTAELSVCVILYFVYCIQFTKNIPLCQDSILQSLQLARLAKAGDLNETPRQFVRGAVDANPGWF
jgi:hypothetical protein